MEIQGVLVGVDEVDVVGVSRMPPNTSAVERPVRLLRRVAKLQALGYSDAWIARRLELKAAQVKAARLADGFAAFQDERPRCRSKSRFVACGGGWRSQR